MATLTWLRALAAGSAGFAAWYGSLWAIPLSIIAPYVTAMQPTRFAAMATAVAYYGAASAPAVSVANSFWPSLGWSAILVWVIAAGILSLPFALAWTGNESARPWTTAMAVSASAIPPLCVVGWASPLVSAGVLFPSAGWVGVAATLALPSALLHRSSRRAALIATVVASAALNLQTRALQVPEDWKAEMTRVHRGRIPDDLAEFEVEYRLQQAALASPGMFLVFPESTIRRWTDVTEASWLAAIAGSGKTLLLGASTPVPGSQLSNNSMVVVSEARRPAVHQRIPVPGGMWNPFLPGGFALNVLGSGIVDVGGQRAAILICYEQLLVWPMLRSAIEHPTLLIAASNEAWTAETRIPKIQHACARSWARLFGLPLLSAINT